MRKCVPVLVLTLKISSVVSIFIYKLSYRRIFLTKIVRLLYVGLYRRKFILYIKNYYFESNRSLRYDF
jgi:hypothetical protein